MLPVYDECCGVLWRAGLCCVLRVACCVLRVACRVSRVACRVLRVACCVLCVACCVLRVACCVLRVVCCVLRVVWVCVCACVCCVCCVCCVSCVAWLMDLPAEEVCQDMGAPTHSGFPVGFPLNRQTGFLENTQTVETQTSGFPN